MHQPREYGFAERMAMSEGFAETASVERILLEQIPGAIKVRRADLNDDRSGTDWWVEIINGTAISVDAKVRDKDWSLRGCDDLALETWSVVDQKIGWTRDPQKRTEYVLWLWRESGRWCLIPFRMLCRVFELNFVVWCATYKTATQSTPAENGRMGWKSECVFVPRKIIWAEIYKCFGGAPQTTFIRNKTDAA